MKPTDAPTTCWLHAAVHIRESEIEGRGLCTAEPLAPETVVLRLGGRVVTRSALLAMFETAAQDSDAPYIDCTSIDEGYDLVLPPGQAIHFGNHSCDPNLWHIDAFTLAARRDIDANEELMIDYATQSDGELSMICRCGSGLCRGTVTGTDWRLPVLQARYGEHWVPALLRRIRALVGS